MIARPFEQRNPYRGSPPRPWIQLRFTGIDGTIEELDLLADTGNPCALIISQAKMAVFKQRDALNANSNFGLLEGGWIHLQMPELGLVQDVLGYSCDAVVTATKTSSPGFEGLAGLPLLRLMEYGGDADWFWLRTGQNPVSP
jgi:hypothetical protein